MIRSYGWSDTGCVRQHNEDRILVDDTLSLYIVADGMGGHNHGEVAAEMAVKIIQRYIDTSRNLQEITWPFGYDFERSANENRLSTAIRLASRQVWEKGKQAPELDGMGTTVVALLLETNVATVASVGDSRVYLFSGGALEPLTIDDTWVEHMVRQGTLAASEVAQHPMRNVLTQAAGSRSSVEVQLVERRIAGGDRLLLSSDGLHGVVTEEEVRRILKGAGDTETAAKQLVEAALDLGGPDNVSCVVVEI